jgi:flagellar biosynthesis regulator FlbT
LEKSRKQLENREKTINVELAETEDEIRDFQKEKLSKLNQLDVSIVLKIKQIQNLMTNGERFEQWKQIREKQFNEKIKAISNDDNIGGEEKDQMIADLQKKY